MPFSGRFVPKNPQKYLGDPTGIVFRSSWERRFMRYCDDTTGVLKWASEEFHIPYVSPADGHLHRYFPDFFITVKTTTGTKSFVIEIKPAHQTVQPQPKKRQTRRYMTEVVTYGVNMAKWAAAEELCRQKGWHFLVLTEQHLFQHFK